MIKAIIFDMDGTILYTLQDLADSTNYALEKCGFKKRSLDEIRNFVGNGAYKLIERATEAQKPAVEKCYKIFLEHYGKNSANSTQPYKNAVETLKKLKEKGLKLAVLSNKPDSEVKKLSEKYFKGIFDISRGESVEFPKKPDPAALLSILSCFGIGKDECFLAGDSEVDLETAQNAGIGCLSVCWGYKSEEFLIQNGADKLFRSFSELFNYLEPLLH